MATYAEIFDLRSHDVLRNKIAVAACVKAAALIDGATPTAAQIAWAKAVIADPIPTADGLLKYLLAKNNTLTVAQLTATTDAAAQTAVSAAVDKILSIA